MSENLSLSPFDASSPRVRATPPVLILTPTESCPSTRDCIIYQLMKQSHQKSPSESSLSEAFALNTNAISKFNLSSLNHQKKNFLNIFSQLFHHNFSIKDRTLENSTLNKKSLKKTWLKDKNYKLVISRLKHLEGYPWENIKAINHPVLIEQLIDLVELCEKNVIVNDSLAASKIMDFALQICQLTLTKNSDTPRFLEIINEAKSTLAKLIYLVDNDLNTILNCLNAEYYYESLERIKKSFDQSMNKIQKDLTLHYEAHDKARLQSADLARYTRIPIEIAKALITHTGAVNLGLIDSLSSVFISSHDSLLNYNINLSYTLRLLQRSPELTAQIEEIHAPPVHSPASDIIRATLNISTETILSDLHAKQTVLAALLSHPRQSSSGSCFATSIVNKMMSAHMHACLKDLKQIIEKGKLSRHFKGQDIDIPFLKHIGDNVTEKVINLSADGYILVDEVKSMPLWEVPGILAVIHSLGEENIQKVLEEVLNELFLDRFSSSRNIQIKDLMTKICKNAANKQMHKETPLSQLISQACFAFSSQTTSPLLKVWENAIAGMSEANQGSMIKSFILQSLTYTFEHHLTEKHIQPTPLIQVFLLALQKELLKNIQLQYDPCIGSISQAEDLHSQEGGFVLYNFSNRIDNEKDFSFFVKAVLIETYKKVKNQVSNSQVEQELNALYQIFYSYTDTPSFLYILLSKYHPSNIEIRHHSDYNHLDYTPWITITGRNSKMLWGIYLEAPEQIKTESFSAKTSRDLLAYIIDKGKNLSDEEKIAYFHNSHLLTPLRIPGIHTFSLMLGHPSISRAWQDDCSTEEWIELFVIEPGRQISESPIHAHTVQQLIHYIEEDILPLFLVQIENKEISNHYFTHTKKNFLAEMDKLPKNLTVRAYRQEAIRICQEIFPVLLPLKDKLTRKIDAALCQSLEIGLRHQLLQSTIRFADTNWCNGTQDIHFCFAVNPGSSELEMWEVDDKGIYFSALNQEYWVIDKSWEFFSLPSTLLTDDGLLKQEAENR